jgi:hypothetical protein
MISFQLYIEDVRYAVPTLYFVECSDESRATEIAFRKLAESQFHLGVEVRRGDECILGIGSYAREKSTQGLYGRIPPSSTRPTRVPESSIDPSRPISPRSAAVSRTFPGS